MTTAVARPADGPRPARGTRGRRVLHVVLFLGVLLALGLLFGGGGEAHATPRVAPEPPVAGPTITAAADTAADTTADTAADTRTDTTTGRVTGRAEESVPTTARLAVRDTGPEPVPETATAPDPERAPVEAVETVRRSGGGGGSGGDSGSPVETRPVQDAQDAVSRTDLGTVRHTAQEAVRDTARGAVQGISGVLGSVTDAVPPVPLLPHPVPSAPAMPSVPPVPLLPGPTNAPSPASSDGSADSLRPGAAASLGSTGPTATQASDSGSYPYPGAAVSARDGADRAALPEFRQADRRSPVDPCGGAGRTPAADTHTPRGGDQQAAPVAHAPSFGQVRGAGLPATAAPVRDRSGEILEFPG